MLAYLRACQNSKRCGDQNLSGPTPLEGSLLELLHHEFLQVQGLEQRRFTFVLNKSINQHACTQHAAPREDTKSIPKITLQTLTKIGKYYFLAIEPDLQIVRKPIFFATLTWATAARAEPSPPRRWPPNFAQEILVAVSVERCRFPDFYASASWLWDAVCKKLATLTHSPWYSHDAD